MAFHSMDVETESGTIYTFVFLESEALVFRTTVSDTDVSLVLNTDAFKFDGWLSSPVLGRALEFKVRTMDGSRAGSFRTTKVRSARGNF